MTTINLVIMIIYHIISAFIAFVLIWSIRGGKICLKNR